jgi:cell division protein FtsA
MEEIIEHVYYEIKNSGLERKLIAGIVLTGGGALMKHIDQLSSFLTGMEVRIGYPNEHLAKGTLEELASPMYATGIGLVIEGIKRYDFEMEMDRMKEDVEDVGLKKQTVPVKVQDDLKEKKRQSYLDKIIRIFDRDLIE